MSPGMPQIAPFGIKIFKIFRFGAIVEALQISNSPHFILTEIPA